MSRICDRHKADDAKPVAIILRNLQDGSEFDFCKDCYGAFLEFAKGWTEQKPKAEKKGGSK